MADQQMPQTLAANVPTPPASSWTYYYDSALAVPVIKSSDGAYTPVAPFGASATVAASSGINTTLTTITAAFKIPLGTARVGSTYEVTIYGTCTSTAANVSTITLRLGTAGTTGDTAVCTVAPTAATTGTAVPFVIKGKLTIRTIGAGGTCAGTLELLNNGVTGVSAAAVVIGSPGTGVAVNTTVDNYITVSYVAAATTTTSTFQISHVTCVKA